MALTTAGWGQRIDLPEVRKESLLNGMRFLTFEGSPTRVPFLLMVENGAAFDPVEKWGVTHLMLMMMLRQTESMDPAQIRQELQRLDAQLDARADWDALYFFGTAPAIHLNDTLALLASIIVRPSFDQTLFEQARSELLSQVESRASSVPDRTAAVLRSRIFGPNPYGHTVMGTSETVANLYVEDVILQYRRLFVPNQAQLALYHRDIERLSAQMGRRWGSWVSRDALPFTFRRAEPPSEGRVLLLEAPAEEAMLRWGQLGVSRPEPEFIALKIFEQYVTLALPDWAREVGGAAQVRASSEVSGGKMPGVFQFSVQAPPDQLIGYHDRFLALLDDVCAGKIDEARFEEARDLVFQELVSQLADPVSRLRVFLEAELRDLGINYLATYKLRLDRVRPDYFQQVLQRLLKDQGPVLVVAGPTARLQPDLERLGTVELLN